MIQPTRATLLWLLGGLPLALLPIAFGPGSWTIWLVSALAFALWLTVEAFLILSPRALKLDVSTPEILYVGRSGEARIAIRHPTRPGRRFEWVLELGDNLEEVTPLVRRDLEPLVFTLRPTRRGEVEVKALWARWNGPFGLLQRTRRIPLDRTIAVLPDIRTVREEALRIETQRTVLVGQRVQRFLGEGSEFESLKEYQPGYDPRGLDWKATARHRKLLVREFQAERNHPVIIAIDSGHLMREPIHGIAKLDHAVNAALLLSYIALKSGDRVGMVSFDSKVRQSLPPKRGIATFPRIQSHCARIEYSDRETNFTLSIAQISQKFRRRALVVLFTDFVDSITAELMLENMKSISRRHLLLFVGIQDSGLLEVRDAEPRSELAIHRAVVANDLLRERTGVFRELRRRGIQCIDSPPEQLTNALIARYLRIRQREMVG